jgi:hypothetical protein
MYVFLDYHMRRTGVLCQDKNFLFFL